jgi:hypothetical protein
MLEIVMKKKLFIYLFMLTAIFVASNYNVFTWDCTRTYFQGALDDDYNQSYSLHQAYGHEHIIFEAYYGGLDRSNNRNWVCWGVDSVACAGKWLVPALIMQGLSIYCFSMALTPINLGGGPWW